MFSNHYHFVARAPDDGSGAASLPAMLAEFHGETAAFVNRLDGAPGRKVWFNYWETLLTFERSYLARLSYVHQNAVKHGLVRVANQYPWCSAAWFERAAAPSQVKTIYGFRTDAVNVLDDYEVWKGLGSQSGAGDAAVQTRVGRESQSGASTPQVQSGQSRGNCRTWKSPTGC